MAQVALDGPPSIRRRPTGCLRVGLLQIGLRGSQHGRDRDACGRMEAVPVAPRGPASSLRRPQRRANRSARRRPAAEGGDGKQRRLPPLMITAVAPRPAPAATRRMGISWRVAEHALVGGAATRQHRPDKRAEHDPRQPDLPDDGRVDWLHGDGRVPWQMREERVGDGAERHADGADRDTGDQRDDQDGGRTGDRPCSSPAPTGNLAGRVAGSIRAVTARSANPASWASRASLASRASRARLASLRLGHAGLARVGVRA